MFLAIISLTEMLALIALVIGVFTAIAAIVVIRNTKLKYGLLISFCAVIIGSIIVLLRIPDGVPRSDRNFNGLPANRNEQLPHQNLDRVLLMIEESDGAIASSLSEALRLNRLSGTRASELASESALQFKEALQTLLAGEMNAGSTIPYVVVVEGKVSIDSDQPLRDAKEPYFVSTVRGELKAIDTRNGKSRTCNISGVQGDGKDQVVATKNALLKTVERIKSFSSEIASMIR